MGSFEGGIIYIKRFIRLGIVVCVGDNDDVKKKELILE